MPEEVKRRKRGGPHRRREGSQACFEGCKCGRHDPTMLAKRAAAQVGRKDSVETRRRKSEAAARNHWLSKIEYLDETALAYDEVVPPANVERVEGLEALCAVRDRLGIQGLTTGTYRKYGMTEQDWLEMLQEQGWKCPVCLRRVKRFVTDHEHVAGWGKMTPANRKRYVRGLLCIYDNYRVVPSTMTAAESQRISIYLGAYEARSREW